MLCVRGRQVLRLDLLSELIWTVLPVVVRLDRCAREIDRVSADRRAVALLVG